MDVALNVTFGTYYPMFLIYACSAKSCSAAACLFEVEPNSLKCGPTKYERYYGPGRNALAYCTICVR